MVAAVEHRFGRVNRLPLTIEWLSDNGSCYVAGDTRSFARDIGLEPRTTPIESPQSNLRTHHQTRLRPRHSLMLQPPSWITHYNEVHPHKALGYRSPREFIAARGNPCTRVRSFWGYNTRGLPRFLIFNRAATFRFRCRGRRGVYRGRYSARGVHRIQDRSAACSGVRQQIGRTSMNLLILVVDDEPDVEVLFRQQFRRDLRAGRFAMDFAENRPLWHFNASPMRASGIAHLNPLRHQHAGDERS